MQNLIRAMHEVFPTLSDNDMAPTLRLSDCPNWDSMTAVNLMMEIETACGVKLENYEPKDDATLADLVTVVVTAGGKP